LLNGKAGASTNKSALALEKIGWGIAGHRMRMQASDEPAQPHRERPAAERRKGRLHAWSGLRPAIKPAHRITTPGTDRRRGPRVAHRVCRPCTGTPCRNHPGLKLDQGAG